VVTDGVLAVTGLGLAWLKAHPSVKIVCRDRSTALAGAHDGAPHAVQVADRWHAAPSIWILLEGLAELLAEDFGAHPVGMLGQDGEDVLVDGGRR
jgi:hypothetical protein